MKYLFFTNTPAHVHQYKHAVERLASEGHEVHVLGRDYGCTIPLLEYADIDYETYGKCGTTKYSLFRELPFHYANIIRKARRFDPDLIFGIGAYSAHAGAVTRTPVITIFDSEPTTVDHTISKPFTNALITPAAFQKDLGDKHYIFDGFKETAYLHPDVFESSTDEIRQDFPVDKDASYVILRFNAFGSHHDVGESGFTQSEKEQLINALSDYATVLVSDEGDNIDFEKLPAQPFDLHPAKMHDALAGANLLVADTQTMVTEAALLGTPAIRSNSFVGESDMGNFKQLEEHGLVHNESELAAVLSRSKELLKDDTVEERWQRRRETYLRDKVNLTALIVELATEFDQSNRSIGEIVCTNERLV